MLYSPSKSKSPYVGIFGDVPVKHNSLNGHILCIHMHTYIYD